MRVQRRTGQVALRDSLQCRGQYLLCLLGNKPKERYNERELCRQY